MTITTDRKVLPAFLGRLEFRLAANHRGVHGLTVLALVLLGLAGIAGAGCEAKAEAADKPSTAPPVAATPQLPREADPALEAMRQAFEKNPNPYVAVVLAQQYAAAGKKNLAAQVLKAALSLPELDATSALKVASAFEALGDSKGQRLALEKADAIAPNSPDVQAQIRRLAPPGAGSQAAPQDPVAAARKAFDKVPSAQNGFGLFAALLGAGRLDESGNFLTKLQHMSFPAAYDYTLVGFALASAGRVSDAEALGQKAIRIDTNSIEGYLLLAHLALMQSTGNDPSRQSVFGAFPADPNLPEAVAQRISDLLEASFAASLNKRATDATEDDTIESALTSRLPVWVIMRQRPDFKQRLTTKWIPLREKQEAARDPAYYKLMKACEALMWVPSEHDEAAEQAWKRLTDHYRLPYTNSLPPTLQKAADLLEEALSINRNQAMTNPGVECLLVTAFLQPRIAASTNRAPMHRVLWSALRNTPVPKAWCEDFSAPDTHFLEWDSLDELATRLKGLKTDPLVGAAPLSLPDSQMCSHSLVRPNTERPTPPPDVPAEVQRFGPQTVESALSSLGFMVAAAADGLQADAEFTREIERLLQKLFSKGYSPALFELTGTESMDEEAAKDLADHVARHILTRIVRQESGFYLIMETAVGRFSLVQFKGPLRISVHRNQLTEIDNANGLRWSGGLQISFGSAGRLCSGGRWGKWQQMSGVLERYGIGNEHGAWTITWTGKTRFHRPSFRQIKDALGGQ